MSAASDRGLPRRLGPFRLEERLGAGSVGVIYRATTVDPSLKMPTVVAIKVLPEQDHDLRHIERFKHEVAIARAAKSRHLAKIYGAGQSDDGPFMVVEFLDGKPLSRIIPRLRKQPEILSVDQRIKIFAGAARGLAALHTAFDPKDGTGLGATHRDISPGNLMLTKAGRLVVIDLGLGRSKLRHFETQTGVVVGTPAFMAPEVARGGIASTQADVYALGVALFEFVTLNYFVPRTSVARMLQLAQQPDHSKLDGIRSDLQSILRKSLAVDPAARFESAVEFESALRPLVQDDLPIADAVRLLMGNTEAAPDEATKVDDHEPEIVLTPTAMSPARAEESDELVEATWIELDGQNQALLDPRVLQIPEQIEAAGPTLVNRPRQADAATPLVSVPPDPAVAPLNPVEKSDAQSRRAPTQVLAKKTSPALRIIALVVIVGGAFSFGYLTKSVTGTTELSAVPTDVVLVEPNPRAPQSGQSTAQPGAVPKPQPTPLVQTKQLEEAASPKSTRPTKTARRPALPTKEVPPPENVQQPEEPAAVLGRLSRRIAKLQSEQPQRRAELETELAKAVRWATHPDSEIAIKELALIEKRIQK